MPKGAAAPGNTLPPRPPPTGFGEFEGPVPISGLTNWTTSTSVVPAPSTLASGDGLDPSIGAAASAPMVPEWSSPPQPEQSTYQLHAIVKVARRIVTGKPPPPR